MAVTACLVIMIWEIRLIVWLVFINVCLVRAVHLAILVKVILDKALPITVTVRWGIMIKLI